MSQRVDVLIAGGGIIGSAVAWALAQRGVGGVAVVDLDLSGLYASSELNAGGARATWWQPVNIATCAATLEFFRQHRDEFGFRENGYLWLYADADLLARAREHLPLQNSYGLGVEILKAGDITERFPLVDRHLDEIAGATFSPRDGLVNPNAVRRWYREQARAAGVEFLNRHYIAGVTTRLVSTTGQAAQSRRAVASVNVQEVAAGDAFDESGTLRGALTKHHVPAGAVAAEERIDCEALVNCLGAWSPLFSARIGVADFTEPVRRQVALVDVRAADRPPEVDFAALGMIVDASGLYFHPEGAHVLAGYSVPDEAPGYDFTYDGRQFFETHVWPRLAHRCSVFERCGHVDGWAGLYAVTPDRSGIVGAVEGFTNLFEAHSFTGRGVMQSYAIGIAAAEILTTGRSQTIDVSALSRERFSGKANWVKEDLHI